MLLQSHRAKKSVLEIDWEAPHSNLLLRMTESASFWKAFQQLPETFQWCPYNLMFRPETALGVSGTEKDNKRGSKKVGLNNKSIRQKVR